VTCATFAVLKRESSSIKNHGGPAKGGLAQAPLPLKYATAHKLFNLAQIEEQCVIIGVFESFYVQTSVLNVTRVKVVCARLPPRTVLMTRVNMMAHVTITRTGLPAAVYLDSLASCVQKLFHMTTTLPTRCTRYMSPYKTSQATT